MKYETFKEELNRQIKLNMSYFKPKEIKVLFDFLETIAREDFKGGHE